MNYSLLRPFDLDAFKSGEKVCWANDGDIAIEAMLVRDRVIPVFEKCFESERCCVLTLAECGEYLRMAPLFWLDEKPVYKGDVLYRPKVNNNIAHVVEHIRDEYVIFNAGQGSEYHDNRRGFLTWDKPKVDKVGWVNVYPCISSSTYIAGASHVYPEYDAAVKGALPDLISTVMVEWKE